MVFRAAWWGTELPNLRPRVSTYGRYEYEAWLPPPWVRFDGTFDWLRAEPPNSEWSILDGERCDVPWSFNQLTRFCSDRSITLPQSFLTFFRDERLAEQIRSCTACFLDLAPDVIASPKGAGSIIRF